MGKGARKYTGKRAHAIVGAGRTANAAPPIARENLCFASGGLPVVADAWVFSI